MPTIELTDEQAEELREVLARLAQRLMPRMPGICSLSWTPKEE